MVCSGSLHLTTLETPAGEDAANGTAFGELVRHIQMGTNPLPKVASNGVYFDDEMFFYAPIIAKRIPANATSEVKVGWKTNAGIVVQGSYDFAYFTDDTLFVEDVKYGYGIVDVVKNWQLIVYAIGEIIRLNKFFPNIVLKIHQPRPYHEDGDCREWKITYQELLDLKEEIERRAMHIAQGNKEFVTSEKCKYCPGVAFECVAFNRAFNNAVDVVLNDTLAANITEAEIASQLNVMERIKDIFKIKKDAVEIAKGKKRLSEALDEVKKDSDALAILKSVLPKISSLSIQDLSKSIEKASMDKKKRAALASNENTDELRKAANSLSKKISGEKEAPSTGKERRFIRKVFTDVINDLKNKYGIEMGLAG